MQCSTAVLVPHQMLALLSFTLLLLSLLSLLPLLLPPRRHCCCHCVLQVCVPLYQAIVLTYPERVTEYNITKLKTRVLNGHANWPGANFVVLGSDGARIWLRDEKVRRKFANELKVCL
jgi:hypothetical protein